jgi:pullulanase/glycogen debranching enzyme
MHDFVRQIIAFRKAHKAAFAPKEYGGGMNLAWLNEYGATKTDWSDRHLMMHYSGGDANGEKPVLVLINGEGYDLTFDLPAGSWARVIDTGSWWDSTDGYLAGEDVERYVSSNAMVDAPIALSNNEYTVSAYAMVVIEGQ